MYGTLLVILSTISGTPDVNINNIDNLESTKNYLYNYFESNIDPNGGVYDRQSNRNLISTAATGFAFKVWAINATSKAPQVSRKKALERINKGFDFVISNTPESSKGIIWHFLYPNGQVPPGTEASTIETAIFYAGARQSSWILFDLPLMFKVNYYFQKIDLDWLIKDGYIGHGFTYSPSGEIILIDYRWDSISEGTIIYKLFNRPFLPAKVDYCLPLFTFYYPLCFYDDPEMIKHLRNAIEYQKNRYGNFGRTAGDCETRGYQAFEPNTISPLAILTLGYYLGINDETTKKYSGLEESRDLLTGWISKDSIGIERGSFYILLNKE